MSEHAIELGEARVLLGHEQADRFWSKVDRTGACWLWTTAVDKDGYGKFQLTTGTRPKQLHVRAHRLSYELAHGPLLETQILLHSCDTPRCVKPAHLKPGTQTENRADCTSKGRNATGDRSGSRTRPEARPKGSGHHNASLKETDVMQIREALHNGFRQAEIARALGVSRDVVGQIARGRTWRHV